MDIFKIKIRRKFITEGGKHEFRNGSYGYPQAFTWFNPLSTAVW